MDSGSSFKSYSHRIETQPCCSSFCNYSVILSSVSKFLFLLLWQKQLKGERTYCNSKLKVQSVHRGKEVSAAGAWITGHLESTVRRQRVKDACCCSVPFLFLFSQGSQPREWCHPQRSGGGQIFPSQYNQYNPHKHAQGLISQASLGFVTWPPILTITLYLTKKAYGGNVTNIIMQCIGIHAAQGCVKK